MKATQELHNLGQSLWLDNITRDLLDNGTLKRYIDEFSVTGLTSNPTIFEHAISKSKSYDSEIGRLASKGLSGEDLFFELALQDLTRAADLFASIHERTAGNDGFVSLEVSPLLAYDASGSSTAAIALHKKANRPNIFIKIPVPILLVRRAGSLYAMADTCSHFGGPLSDGKLVDNCIECPYHASRFDLNDGHVVNGPAVHSQPCLEIRTRNGQIELRKASLHIRDLQTRPQL
jgi:nitrite reductase/ring-hydroxylating ferredoxin subunit